MARSDTALEPQLDIRLGIRQLLADRHTPEARGLYLQLARYVHGRVSHRCANRYRGLLGNGEQEELVAEVLIQLISGALARFEGDNLAALLAFVRTVTDRTVGHAARRRLRELRLVEGADAARIEAWHAVFGSVDQSVVDSPSSPFTERDRAWLEELFRAGSRAELARQAGLSRAAITQRLQRVQERITRMEPGQRQQAEAWLEEVARRGQRGELLLA